MIADLGPGVGSLELLPLFLDSLKLVVLSGYFLVENFLLDFRRRFSREA